MNMRYARGRHVCCLAVDFVARIVVVAAANCVLCLFLCFIFFSLSLLLILDVLAKRCHVRAIAIWQSKS